MLDDPLCLVVLAVYVRDLRMGNNLKDRDDLQADTLTGYVRSAHRALSHYQNNRHIDILDPHNSGKSKNFLGRHTEDRDERAATVPYLLRR